MAVTDNQDSGEGGGEPPHSKAELWALLRRYNEYPAQRPAVLADIQSQFTRRLAVLALDSSGFSRTTRAMGIVHFLALLERLERTVRPLIEQYRGRVLKTEADNIFGVFSQPADAVRAAVRIQEAIRAVNELLPADEEIEAAIGLGYGDMLVVGSDDVFGDEMNITCKLGEDLAQRGEILLTSALRAALADDDLRHPIESVHFSVSGLSLPAFRLLWEQHR